MDKIANINDWMNYLAQLLETQDQEIIDEGLRDLESLSLNWMQEKGAKHAQMNLIESVREIDFE